MLVSRQLRLFLLIILTCIVSACSTTGSNNDTDDLPVLEDKSGANEDAKEAGVKEGEAGNEVVPFLGPDPMADIQVNAEIKKAYSDVAKLTKAKKFAQAIELMLNIQTKYPQLSGPDYQRARVLFVQKKYQEALTAINASISSNPRNYYSLNFKGIILREMGRFEEAKSTYRSAIEIFPPYPNSHLNLGVLLDLYMRDLSSALAEYNQYMRLTGGTDKKVANWIIEIERRIKAGN